MTGSLTMGVSYTLTDTCSVDIGFGIGLSRDSPDFQFSASIPMRVLQH
jgi:hypothetical protein